MQRTETLTSSPFESLSQKLEGRTAQIGIIGLGYVGLPLLLLFSEEKFGVTGFDIDPKKIQTLTQGCSYIVRIPDTEIRAAQAVGFTATSDYSHIAQMDEVIICVATPLNHHHYTELSFID